jgi:hypothetical protein
VVLRVVRATGMAYPISDLGSSAWAISPLTLANNCADIL